MNEFIWLAVAVVVAGFVVTAPIRASARAALAEAQAARRALSVTRSDYQQWVGALRRSGQHDRDEVRAAARRRRKVRSHRWDLLTRWIALQSLMLVLFGATLRVVSGTDLLARWSDGRYWELEPYLVLAGSGPTLVVDLLVNVASQRARPLLAGAGTWVARTTVAVVAIGEAQLSSASALVLFTVIVFPSLARATELQRVRRTLGCTAVVAAADTIIGTVPMHYRIGTSRVGSQAKDTPPRALTAVPARQLAVGKLVGRGNTAEIFTVRFASGADRSPGTIPTDLVYKKFAEPIPWATFTPQRDLLLRPFTMQPESGPHPGLMWPRNIVTNGSGGVTGLLISRVPPAFRLRDGQARRGDAAIHDQENGVSESYSDDERLAVGHDVAAALAALHAVGLVHTDLSWSNISCSRIGPLRAVLLDCDSVADIHAPGLATRSTLGWTIAGDNDNLTVERARLSLLIWRLAIQDLGDDQPDGRQAAAWLSPPMRSAIRASDRNPRASPAASWWESRLRAAEPV